MKIEVNSFTNIAKTIVSPFVDIFITLVKYGSIAFVIFVILSFVQTKANLFKIKGIEGFKELKFKNKLMEFIKFLIYDIVTMRKEKGFPDYGLTVFCGRQGSGKTVSLVNYLNQMKFKYPKCKIVTNFAYAFSDYRMKDWQDFLELRNGEDGIIFAIDEIHTEYSSSTWKDFPENILSEISQQRKQKVKIVASSQVFSRMVKPLREQSFTVVECSTFLKRWTFCKMYDAWSYEVMVGSGFTAKGVKGLKAYQSWSFVQDDILRNSYNTYEKIERLRNTVKDDRKHGKQTFQNANERVT